MIDLTSTIQVRVPGVYTGNAGRWPPALATPPVSSLVGDRTSLRLPADQHGALRLDSVDGSLGRLTLPTRIAVDGSLRVYLLDPKHRRVLMHDPSRDGYDPTKPFLPIPTLGGDTSPDDGGSANPRRFVNPTALAADKRALYVVDTAGRRVLVIAVENWALSDLWMFDEPAEAPIDVATDRGSVYILTPSALYHHRPGDGLPRRVAARPATSGPWSRVAVDLHGQVYLLRTDRSPVLDLWTPGRGFDTNKIHDAAEVRDNFQPPAVTSWPVEPTPVEPTLYYLIPDALSRPCGRVWPDPNADFGTVAETSPVHAPPADQGTPESGVGFVVDDAGGRFDSARLRPPRKPLFIRDGAWVSPVLDSSLFRCQWDVAVLNLVDLAPGTIVAVSTFTSDDRAALDRALPPERAWAPGYAVVGGPRVPGSPPLRPIDFLIGSPPGRYLWFRVRMEGDGFSTPALGSVDLRLPRQSYTQYLPAVFLEDEPSRRFLERFLAIFQTEWDSLEERVDAIPALADPRVVPESQIDTLAGWLGQKFEPGWSVDQRRDLLQALPDALFAERPRQSGDNEDDDPLPGGLRRGTPAGLRDYLRAVLRSLAKETDPLEFPFVIEGFRERDYFVLQAKGGEASVLGGLEASAVPGEPGEAKKAGSPLWSPDLVGRFRLGESSRLDEGRLLPRGDTDIDVFAHHAHRFRVVLPESLVADASSEAVLRRVIESEKPAHTAYELDLVGPRFRVGVQSTVGIDTIVGGLPGARLDRVGGERSEAPSAPPSNRLGYDTVLSGVEPPPPLPLADGRPGSRARGGMGAELRLGVGVESRAL